MKQLMLCLLAAITLTACTDNGKKIKVEGTKGEVYYKGDGVTEDDAKKAGQFLKENYFTADKGATVQLTKDADAYTVRFVYDKSVFDTLKGVEDAFKMIGVQMSKEVFAGKKVNIALADRHMKDFKSIPYDEATAKSMETPPAENTGAVLTKADFEHEKMADVDFFWKGISDDESKTIADYIVKNGSFSGGTAEIYMTKEAGRYILRFPVIASARADEAVLSQLDKVTKLIKDDLFADVPFSFYMTDENYNTVKAWDY